MAHKKLTSDFGSLPRNINPPTHASTHTGSNRNHHIEMMCYSDVRPPWHFPGHSEANVWTETRVSRSFFETKQTWMEIFRYYVVCVFTAVLCSVSNVMWRPTILSSIHQPYSRPFHLEYIIINQVKMKPRPCAIAIRIFFHIENVYNIHICSVLDVKLATAFWRQRTSAAVARRMERPTTTTESTEMPSEMVVVARRDDLSIRFVWKFDDDDDHRLLCPTFSL